MEDSAAAAALVVSTGVGATATTEGSGGAVTMVGSVTTGGARGCAVFFGVASAVEVAGTAISGSELIEALLVALTGRPQFVQKPVRASSMDPQFVQKAVGKVVAGPALADSGGVDATAGTASAPAAG